MSLITGSVLPGAVVKLNRVQRQPSGDFSDLRTAIGSVTLQAAADGRFQTELMPDSFYKLTVNEVPTLILKIPSSGTWSIEDVAFATIKNITDRDIIISEIKSWLAENTVSRAFVISAIANAKKPKEFRFDIPASTWVVNHYFGYVPEIKIIDSTGEEVWGDVFHENNNNTTRIVYASDFSGKVYVYP